MNDTRAHKWLITFTVMTGTLMAALDSSIVNVALPYMRGNLGATVEEITWVSTGYILSNVIIMPIIALLTSRFGRKYFYLFCVFIFTVSSMLCGIAWDLPSLVVFRIMQGIGGGALIPGSQAVLRETFPPEEQGLAMGVFGMGVMVGPALGPTLGGWLTEHYSWPWIFYINVPIGILNLILVWQYLHDPPYLIRDKGTIDWLGLALMATGLGALQLMLEKGQMKNWFESRFIIYLAMIAVFGLLFFIWRELTTDKPAVDLRICKDKNFSNATFIGGIIGLSYYSGMFLLPIFFQELLGYSAADSGLMLMPRFVSMGIAMLVAGRFYPRIGLRNMLCLGLAAIAFSFWELAHLSLDVGFWFFFTPLFIQGMGFGMVFVALSTAALSSIALPRMQAASGLYNVVRLVFGTIGIAVTATLMDRGQNSFRALLVEKITVYSDITTVWKDALSAALFNHGADHLSAYQGALKLLDGSVKAQAMVLSLNQVFFLMVVFTLISLPLVFLFKKTTSGNTAGK